MHSDLLIRTLKLANAHQGDLRRVLARLLVARGPLEVYARLSMLEGLLGEPQGSLAGGSPSARDLIKAKELMTPDQWGSAAQYEQFFDPRSKPILTDAVEWGVKNGINKAPHWFGSAGLDTEEEILQSLNIGLGLGNQRARSGGNIYRRTGLSNKNRSRIGIGGLIKSLKDNANKDVTSRIRQYSPPVSGDAQVGDAEDALTLFDLMEGGLKSAPMKNLMSQATPRLKRKLTPSQFEVWNVVLADPDLISNRIRNGVPLIDATDAARAYERLYSQPIANTTIARTWARAWPAIMDELEKPLGAWGAATGRLAGMATRVASRYLQACGDEPCAKCDACDCGGKCDGNCGAEEAMMEKTSPAPGGG